MSVGFHIPHCEQAAMLITSKVNHGRDVDVLRERERSLLGSNSKWADHMKRYSALLL
jgi:hypothetical protein